jgi:arylsulfatase A-like enzyme
MHMNEGRFNRRVLARLALAGALCLAARLAPAASAAPRPNFLFIYTDDQRWDALGVVQREQGERARFPWFQTPHLDRLAAEGVRFRNAFVVNALCSPSRACFLTGRYSHFNGVANNHTPFPTNSVTHASLLRAAGYTTGYIGKWHMDGQRGQRPGFDYSASFIGHARYHNASFEINGLPTPTQGWVDDVSTDYAIEFLKRNKDKPWLLVVGYKTPHGPFEPPARLKDKFAGEGAKVPPNLNAAPPFPVGDKTSGAKQRAAEGGVNLNYFRCLAGVDENVGRLLATLDELGLADNTMVVYSSDNGFYHGEHGLSDKRSAYEESIRIPLLVRFPRLDVKGRAVDELALNIDLAPTFLDFAGVAVPPEMQGRSWRPLFDALASAGRPPRAEGASGTPWRASFFYEYFYERNFFTPTVTAVRTAAAKLIKYPDHDEWTELFDLRSDPYETRNLFRDPAHRALREQMEAEYARQAKAVGFRIPDFADNPKPDAK